MRSFLLVLALVGLVAAQIPLPLTTLVTLPTGVTTLNSEDTVFSVNLSAPLSPL